MKDNKKTEVQKSSETTDTQEKKIKDQDTNVMEIDKEFDLRERRLKLVYTILYVLAALWAALFISYGNTNDSAAPAYCGLLAAITTSILNILYFIVGEFRCLRIYKKLTMKLAMKQIASSSKYGIHMVYQFVCPCYLRC